MTRYAFALACSFGLVTAAIAGVTPPIPHIPTAALKGIDTKPPEPPAEADDPAKIADRIAQNTKAIADRLATDDTGDETRKTQEQTLKDIDALLKSAQNPPPMGGGSGDMSDMPPPPGGGGGTPPPMGGSGKPMGGSGKPMGGSGKPMGGSGKPMGGSGKPMDGSGKPMGGSDWRERRQQEQAKKEPGDKPGDQQANKPGDKDPMPANNDPTGSGAQPGNGGGKSAPALPLDDAITKQVWGHLPERLRQQMSQYYKEQFMPKYGDMLRQYYSSLAEREKAPKK